MNIQAAILTNNKLTNDLLSQTLEREGSFTVVANSTDPHQAVDQITDCNLVLVSADLPNNGTIKFIQTIRKEGYNGKIVVIGIANIPDLIISYIEAGASGYVLQDDSITDLYNKMMAVHSDQPIISPTVTGLLLQKFATFAQNQPAKFNHPTLPIESLTQREKEVCQLLIDQNTNNEIAKMLFVEVGTVKNHVHNILKKLNVKSRTEVRAYSHLFTTSSGNMFMSSL
jgi:two-component system NarL family response regulator